MSAEQENFKDLRRLLTLKRYEQPPPGFFNDFSGRVIARIHAGEAAAARSWTDRALARAPWLRGFWDGFGAKPIAAGAFGVGVCSLLIVGLVSSERVDTQGATLAPQGTAAEGLLATMPRQSVIGTSLYERSLGDHSFTGGVYTAQQTRSSIFEELRQPHVQSVSYSTSGN